MVGKYRDTVKSNVDSHVTRVERRGTVAVDFRDVGTVERLGLSFFMATTTKVAVEPNPEQVIEERVLADSIVKIGAGLANLQRGGLNKRAIVVLLHDLTGVPKKHIIAVIDGIQSLKTAYTVTYTVTK